MHIRVILMIVGSVVALPLLCSICRSASFNCGATGLTKTEQTICTNTTLSVLDAKLASLFVAIRSSASGAQKASVVAAQRAWIARRNECPNTECLAAAYNDRIAQLSAKVDQGSPPPPLSVSSPANPNPPSGTVTSGMPSARSSEPVTTVSDAPSDLTALDREIEAGLAATQQLEGKQVGFKDFRLGNSMTVNGNPKGTSSCRAIVDFSPEKNLGIQRQALEAFRARWFPIIGTFKECSATTTVFENQVSVTYSIAGRSGTIFYIHFEAPNQDLPGIAAALSKRLGAPKETISRQPISEVRQVVLKQTREECDNMRSVLTNMGNTAQPEIDKCYKSVEARTDIKMGMSKFPPEGIVKTIRDWSQEGVNVGYMSLNIEDEGKVQFISTAMNGAMKQALEAMKKEFSNLEEKTKKGEDDRKARDF